MPSSLRMRLEKMPRWVKYLISESSAALEALAIAVAIPLRSCDSSIWAIGLRPEEGAEAAPPDGACPSCGVSLFSPPSPGSLSLFWAGGAATSGGLKNRSKHSPSARLSSVFLASVSRKVSRRTSRSVKPISETARMASMLSEGDIRTPAPRAARKNRCRFSRIDYPNTFSRRVLPMKAETCGMVVSISASYFNNTLSVSLTIS